MRLSTHLRMAFHDWMWDGGASPDVARRLARRLPLYFSDPEHISPAEFDRRLSAGAPVAFAVHSHSPFVEVNPAPKTWTTGNSTVFTHPYSTNPHA